MASAMRKKQRPAPRFCRRLQRHLGSEHREITTRNAPPKSYVMKVEKTGPSAFLVTTDAVGADGKERHQQFTRTYDGVEHAGKEHPEATETCNQVDPVTRHIVGENNGKVVYEIDAKMAPDRKTMTTRQTYFSPVEQTREVLVFAFERR
jgi:hypothetical protein